MTFFTIVSDKLDPNNLMLVEADLYQLHKRNCHSGKCNVTIAKTLRISYITTISNWKLETGYEYFNQMD